jgi:hypothetical protein
MSELKAPLEMFDIGNGDSMVMLIVGSELGECTIHSRRENREKRVDCLRAHLAPGFKTIGMPYWDITSKTLIAQLEPLLINPPPTGKRFKITKHGVAPAARFQVEML